jgi:hypothetical protein
MFTVYVLMGLPGSGKTTWRNRFVAACYGAAHAVARDDVVEEVAAVHGITYREVWAIHSKGSTRSSAAADGSLHAGQGCGGG